MGHSCRRRICHIRRRASTYLFVGAMLMSACARPPLTTTQSATIGQPFALKVGRSLRFADQGLEIAFEKVVSDSRCPRSVQCIRAGEAIISVAMEKPPDARAAIELRTTPSAVDAFYGTYSIRLLSLNPYPDGNRPIEPQEYEAMLVVRNVDITRPQP